jgi:hypothetical protein
MPAYIGESKRAVDSDNRIERKDPDLAGGATTFVVAGESDDLRRGRR